MRTDTSALQSLVTESVSVTFQVVCGFGTPSSDPGSHQFQVDVTKWLTGAVATYAAARQVDRNIWSYALVVLGTHVKGVLPTFSCVAKLPKSEIGYDSGMFGFSITVGVRQVERLVVTPAAADEVSLASEWCVVGCPHDTASDESD